MTNKIRFSWTPLYECARPEGYRVVIEVPSKASITIQVHPEDNDDEPAPEKPLKLNLRNNCCFVNGDPTLVQEQEEHEILATSRPLRPIR